MLGKELIYNNNLNTAEKIYIRIFGVPINGLRIRARRILPLISNDYKNILDAGCGPGVFSFAIAKKFPNSMITGYDINRALIKIDKDIAGKLALKNCSFEIKDICLINDKEKFDLILSIDNLEHIEDDENAMKKFYEALKKGGDLILHVPGLYRRWKLFGWSQNFYVAGHFRPGYTKEQIEQLAQKVGFKIGQIYYTYGWLETITNNISYWITKAEMENKYLYAFIFPFLNFISYFGQWSRPKKGAGVLTIMSK